MNVNKHLVPGNFGTGRQGRPITGIVLHTMVGTTAGSQARFENPDSDVSVHYGVSLDGSVTQWVEEYNTAYQAGNWRVNLETIGIEHEDGGNYNDAVRTEALYEASSDLVADICTRYNIPCDSQHIYRHGDVIDKTAYPGGTACPDALNTDRIIAMAQAKLGGDMIQTPDDAAEVTRSTLRHEPTPHEIDDLVGRDWNQALKIYRTSQAGQSITAMVEQYPALRQQVADLQSHAQNGSDAKLKQLVTDLQTTLDKFNKG